MCLEGYTVTHKAFGEGQILCANDRYITVRFAGMEKTFVYPDAFKGFMTIADEAVMSTIRADLQKSAEETARVEDRRRREREMQKSKGVVIPGYQPVSNSESPFTTVPDENAD